MSQCYLQLTLPDRRRVHQLLERKVPIAEIARQLGRHRSTIYRELKRNTFHDAEFPEYSGYYSGIANDISKERRRRLRKLSRHPQLRELVIDRLEGIRPVRTAGSSKLTYA
ncbi:TRm24 putative transposase (plasmid) [Sinorhizobium meliloti SM11]|uniref:TRm24 putative transposase n=1 Tax=Sinorhizobium meliloti (strain SM11) TaxID=707241 RepID=F7XB02_SINMM|nr:TRm24 putative transposase [Sinorhizobium meliloti SM11]ARS66923.1 transposase [Sinorhizobium meliloti RU11/001]